MIKLLLIVQIFLISLSAQSFNELLSYAIKNSPYINITNRDINEAKIKKDLELRYKNPTFEFGVGNFKPDIGNSDMGYSISISQPISLIDREKREYSDRVIESSKIEVKLKRADFIRDFSLLYLQYAQSSKFLKYAREQINLAEKIYSISNERFKEGAISKIELLQAKIDFQKSKSDYQKLNMEKSKDYFNLLKFAGVDKKITLEYNYQFKLLNRNINPEIELLESRIDEAKALAEIDKKSIEEIEIFSEYDSEPEEKIFKFGISLQIPIFNSKREEYQLAKLKTQKIELLKKASILKNQIELKRLVEESTELIEFQKELREVLISEKELLNIYEDSYRVANRNLLELQNMKNRVNEMERNLVEVDIQIQKNIIYQNYLQGSYSE